MRTKTYIYLSSAFKAYITCLYGVHIVGRVHLAFGIFSVISSIGMGPITKKIGQMTIFIIAAIANIGVISLLMLWNQYQMNNIIGEKFFTFT